MHISLDSALGRQRRLNSVGESVLQIAPNAAAAYSLRSLTGGDPKVVRVRRASDNGERDFTSTEITSGEMVSWVNRQVIKPLDIQALEADGRTGDFLIAKAAYSLRSLGTRQATLTRLDTFPTFGPRTGKFVVQVRRSSDDKLKSFTADEVTDGTLLAFVNEIQTVGTAVNGTGSFDNYTVSNLSTTGFSADNSAGGTGSAGFPYVFKDDDVLVVKYTVTNFSSTSGLSPALRGVNAINSVTGKTNSGTTFTANGTYTDILTATADGTHLMYADGNTGSYTISNFEIISHSSNGFVRAWYDQSVTTQAGDTATGNHAVQATPAEQPLIVSAGALVADNGIYFDGSTSSRSLVAPSVSGLTGSLSLFSASVRDLTGNSVSLSNSSSGGRYFALQEAGSASVANPRNIANKTVSDSVSGADRLTFAVTTGATSTSVGALGSAVTTSTADYGDDFGSGDLNQIAIGILRTASPTGYFNGRIREILVYTSDQTDNRGAIEANIGEAYSITGIPAYDDEVDGFVETWYDQSGNSKDAVQATAGSQPKIVDAGALVADAGNSAMQFDATNDFLTADSLASNFNGTDKASSVFIKYGGMADTATFQQFYSFSNSSAIGSIDAGDLLLSLFRSNSPSLGRPLGYLIDDDSSVILATSETSSLGANKLVTLVGDRSSDSVFSNGSATTISDLDSTSGALTFNQFSIGVSRRGTGLSNYFSGKMSEFIIYQSDQSANRPALEANIMTNYGIS